MLLLGRSTTGRVLSLCCCSPRALSRRAVVSSLIARSSASRGDAWGSALVRASSVPCRPQSTMAQRNAFTAAVVDQMRRLYPENLADTAWDNVGLLLENSDDEGRSDPRRRVLLTNDLTTPVVDEAIAYGVGVIIAYHPVIFRGLKSITHKDAQQSSLIRLARHNIAVYCPHTALDAAKGGINDWLVDKVVAAAAPLGVSRFQPPTSASPILPVAGQAQDKDVGYGRRIDLVTPRGTDAGGLPAPQLIRAIAQALGGLRHVLVVRPMVEHDTPQWGTVRAVAVCAGSGADILKQAGDDVQLYVTGEMSHHAALEAASRGVWVLCVLHSRSERLFLRERLQPQLQAALDENAAVLVSEHDRDPFEIWDVSDQEPVQPIRRPVARDVSQRGSI